MKPYYDEDGITIYHGDCREVLPDLKSAALGFADPPYGVGFKYGKSYSDDRGAEYERLIMDAFNGLRALSAVVALTPGMRHAYQYPGPDWQMGWFKPGSTRRNALGGFNTWEPILIYGKPPKPVYQDAIRLPDSVNHSVGPASEHPCPKPLSLLAWLVEQLSEPGDCVIDPFMGSGTTLRAAKDAGRQAIGIEIEERYCEIAVQRLAQGVLAFD